jgi:hypothetical protein
MLTMGPMSAAEKIAPAVTELLTWAEICELHPDEWVCLVEIDYIRPGGFEFRVARIVSHGKTRREAFDNARPWRTQYKLIGHYFTGRLAAQPLLRPALVFDDETRDAFRYRW